MAITAWRAALTCLVAAIVVGPAVRPMAAESAEGFLELHVEPTDLPESGVRGGRVWKILTSPPPVVIADEPFKSQLQRAVDAALTEAHPWIANLQSVWSLQPRLSQVMAGTSLEFKVARANDPNGPQFVQILPPKPGQGGAHIFIPFTYVLAPMSRLRIAASSPADPQRSGFAFKEIALPADLLGSVPAQDRGTVASSVAFELRGQDTAFAPGEEARLLKVARLAFEIARDKGVLPPRPVVEDKVRDDVVVTVRTSLIPQPEPVKSAVRLEPVAGEPGLWRLAVSNVVPIEAVKIEARYDLANVLAPGTTISDHAKARLEGRAREIAAELEQRFRGDFARQRGTVLTRAELNDAIKEMLKKGDDRIAGVEDPRIDNGVLTYPIVIKPVVKTLVGSAGVGYTAREGLTGSGGLTEHNLLGWQDDGSIDLKGGPDTRRADLNFGIPLPSDWLKDDRISGRLTLRGLYARTVDTVLGQPRNAAVTEEEHGVFLRQSFVFLPLAPRGGGGPAPADASGPSTSWGLSKGTALGLEVELGRRDVDLSGIAAPAGIPVDGVTAPLSVTFRGSTGLAPGDRTGQRVRSVDLRVESTFERSFAILGSDLTYERWDVRATVDGMFWLFSATPRNDILLRYVHGYGTTTAGTPLFRFLRVGGESNVRGVEEGEFIGRRLQFQQLEVGVGLCSIQQLVFPKKAAGDGAAARPAAAGSECQAGGLDLSRAFLKAFVDHADLSDRAVGRQFVAGSRGITGAGIALELHDLPVGAQKLSLTIGYAYSPDSERHSSGTAFTQVIMPFALR